MSETIHVPFADPFVILNLVSVLLHPIRPSPILLYAQPIFTLVVYVQVVPYKSHIYAVRTYSAAIKINLVSSVLIFISAKFTPSDTLPVGL